MNSTCAEPCMCNSPFNLCGCGWGRVLDSWHLCFMQSANVIFYAVHSRVRMHTPLHILTFHNSVQFAQCRECLAVISYQQLCWICRTKCRLDGAFWSNQMIAQISPIYFELRNDVWRCCRLHKMPFYSICSLFGLPKWIIGCVQYFIFSEMCEAYAVFQYQRSIFHIM